MRDPPSWLPLAADESSRNLGPTFSATSLFLMCRCVKTKKKSLKLTECQSQELGPEVVKVFILPHVAAISRRIDAATEPSSLIATSAIGNIEKIAASHIRNLIVKAVAPIVR